MAPATASRPYCKMAPPNCGEVPLSVPSHCPSQSALTPPGQKWEENPERAAEPNGGGSAGLGGRASCPRWVVPRAARRSASQSTTSASLTAPRAGPPLLPRLSRLSAAGLCSHPAPLPGANAPLKCFKPGPRLALSAQSSSGEAGNTGRGAASSMISPEIGVLGASAMEE